MPKERKTESITIRLPATTLRTLEMIAAGEKAGVGEIIRRAIDQYLNPRRENV